MLELSKNVATPVSAFKNALLLKYPTRTPMTFLKSPSNIVPFDCREDVAVAKTPSQHLGEPMDIMTALQLVLRSEEV